jgi:hypothetical protein
MNKAIPFLDTLVNLKEGRINLDLYRKETDQNQYLWPSCHTKQTTASIPFSHDQANREKQFFFFT